MVFVLQNRKRKREESPASLACQPSLTKSSSSPSSYEPLTSPDHTAKLPSFNLEKESYKPLLTSMSPSGSPRHESQEADETSDSDYEEGDAVLARGWPRHHHNLAKHGFRPVWTSPNEYPGDEIPADIREWLDDNGQRRSAQMIGPLRSLAWLAGLEF